MRAFISVIFISLVGILPARSQSQQGDSLLWRDFAYIRDSDPWLMSTNSAALTRMHTANLSEAEMGISATRGGFIDFYQAAHAVNANVRVESLYRLTERTVVYGAMSYDNFTGHDMAGSAFLCPKYKPFDIVEDSLTNIGKKHSDTYRLTGAVGVDLYHGMALGGRIDYTTANYAKYKDLRHKNSFMDLEATAAVYIPIARSFQLGGNFYYRRNTESLVFSTYGKTDKTYKSLIDYGAFIGEVEEFGVERFTDHNRELPLFDEYFGGGAQVQWNIMPQLRWYNDVNVAHRTGYYGRKSPSTTQLSHHHSRVVEMASRLSFSHGNTAHELDFSLRTENLVNMEEHFRELKNEAGSNYYEYYDAVKTAHKVWADGSVRYTLYMGVVHDMPTTTVTVGVNFFQRKQTAYDFPYFRRQKLDNQEVFVNATHHFPIGTGLMSVTASASYLKGYGKPYIDGTMAVPSDKQTPPPQMQTYLYREYEYLTTSQYSMGLSLRYAYAIPTTQVATYLKGTTYYRKANGNHGYIGRDHTIFSLSLGCLF